MFIYLFIYLLVSIYLLLIYMKRKFNVEKNKRKLESIYKREVEQRKMRQRQMYYDYVLIDLINSKYHEMLFF
jgi:hypothetical protein